MEAGWFMLVAGVDDAGRGSAIGPLVIAGVLLREEAIPKLAALGVRDSKQLNSHARETLAVKIGQVAEACAVEYLSPRQIDDVVLNGRKLHKLNWLEALTMAKVLNKLKPNIAYVDASDVSEERFKQQIQEALTIKMDIVSKHKADQTYPVVSAASIIAKVERDRAIAELAAKYGDFGSGYPSDPRTICFL
ncbi:MAG: ribonuclease HII, partial [Candidatus Bathyarchaeia archaeon]